MAKCALGKTETWRDSPHSRDRHGQTAQTAGGLLFNTPSGRLIYALGKTHVCLGACWATVMASGLRVSYNKLSQVL